MSNKKKYTFVPIGSEVYVDGQNKGKVVRVKKNLFGQTRFHVETGAGVQKVPRERISDRKCDYV